MSILTPVAGERFLLKLFKYWEGQFDREWVNNYFLVAMEDCAQSDLIAASDAIATYEFNLHDSRITWSRGTISTYVPDSDPYDGNEYFTVPYSSVGIRTPGLLGDILPLTDVRFVRLTPSSGRSSLLGYRGSIYEGEVNADSGHREFDSPSTQASLVAAAVATGVDDHLPGGTSPIHLCSGSVSTRAITSITSARPGHLPMKHKHFNTGS